MKVIASIMSVLLAGCALSTSGSVEQPGMTPEDFLQQWASGLSHGSVDEMTGFYKDSEDTLAIQSTGQVRRGTAEIRKEYESAFAEVIFEQVTLDDLAVRQKGRGPPADSRHTRYKKRKTRNGHWKCTPPLCWNDPAIYGKSYWSSPPLLPESRAYVLEIKP